MAWYWRESFSSSQRTQTERGHSGGGSIGPTTTMSGLAR